jgi:hypothetical protein
MTLYPHYAIFAAMITRELASSAMPDAPVLPAATSRRRQNRWRPRRTAAV